MKNLILLLSILASSPWAFASTCEEIVEPHAWQMSDHAQKIMRLSGHEDLIGKPADHQTVLIVELEQKSLRYAAATNQTQQPSDSAVEWWTNWIRNEYPPKSQSHYLSCVNYLEIVYGPEIRALTTAGVKIEEPGNNSILLGQFQLRGDLKTICDFLDSNPRSLVASKTSRPRPGMGARRPSKF